MPHRYPWGSTTHRTPLSNVIASTPTTTTIMTSTTDSYKRVTTPSIKTAPRYTQTTVNSLYTDRYKTRYNNNNDNSNKGIGGGVSTTTRRNINFFDSYYTVSTTPKTTNGPKVNLFKYKSTLSVMSFSTTTKGYQYGPRNDGRGKRFLN